MTTGIYAEAEDGAMRKTIEAIQASVGYRGLFSKRKQEPSQTDRIA